MTPTDTLSVQGFKEANVLTATMRHHQQQIRQLGDRRKALILSMRKEGVTYREIASALDVSEQLIYKIIQDDINRDPILDAEGKVVRHRGRPALSREERERRRRNRELTIADIGD